MENTKKTRLFLFLGSVLTIFIVVAFLVILNINEPEEYTKVPLNVLFILTLIACLALAVFCAKGPVFSIDGKLESANINAMLLTVLVIIQVSFFFEIVSVRNQILNYQKYAEIRKDITIADNCETEELNDTLLKLCTGGITEIAIVDENGTVLHSSDATKIGSVMAATRYSYSFKKTKEIRFLIDSSYTHSMLRSIILNLLTVFVTSIFFSVEIVLLMIRLIMRNLEKNTIEDGKDGQMLSSLYYIRQISFLFYFASRLSSAFIPLMAKSLHNPFPWLSGTAAAGMPQSAETLLTCSAIFLTTVILEKKGWKMPFIAGLLMVAAGTFLSAFPLNLAAFVLARAVVGLGYGFCWMTLRNLSLFGRDAKEQLLGFALLNAGIYAGMNCGASLGAILADLFGYKAVFIISTIMTLLTSVFIIRMENALLPSGEVDADSLKKHKDNKAPKSFTQNLTVALFVLLMIAPASIAASYLSYYLPLYFTEIGQSITDVGRAQLLYGLVIVYAGPFLSVFISKFKRNALKNINLVYNLMIALSLFLPGIGAGLLLPFLGSALLGTADSFGFGVQNNYFLLLPAIKRMGASRSLSVLSFIKKILEMTGPLIFAVAIGFGYQAGIRFLSIIFAIMAILFAAFCLFVNRSEKQEDLV